MMTLFIILVSASLGSFANVLIYRLPKMIVASEHELHIDLIRPASHCPHCHAPLKWWQNIPVLSFIALRRRCLSCTQTIAWQYLWVELGVIVLSIFCVWHWGWTISALAYFVLGYFLWVLAWIDALHYLLPDVLTLSLLWLGLLYQAIFQTTLLADFVFAAAFGYVLLRLVYCLYYGLTQKHGLGFGDMKLLAAIGAWLGLSAIANVLICACVLALLFALYTRVKPGKVLPFGPFLAAAAMIVLVSHLDFGVWLAGWIG